MQQLLLSLQVFLNSWGIEMNLSKHFTLAEFTTSDTATRKGIVNTPTPEQVENLKMVASTLEVIRELVQQPVHVSSGFRCPALNKATGGSAKSAHMEGLAADIWVEGMPAKALARKIADAGIPVDQLIYEGSWVHIGLALEILRHQVLTAAFINGKAQYSVGLPA